MCRILNNFGRLFSNIIVINVVRGVLADLAKLIRDINLEPNEIRYLPNPSTCEESGRFRVFYGFVKYLLWVSSDWGIPAFARF